jgi:uncharacterized membrane protein
MLSEITNAHVIAVMSLVTIFIRFAGFWIMGHIPLTPFVKATLEALPGAILISTVVPICIKTGGVALIGLGVSIVVMYFTMKDYVALFAGLAVVSIFRFYGFQ